MNVKLKEKLEELGYDVYPSDLCIMQSNGTDRICAMILRESESLLALAKKVFGETIIKQAYNGAEFGEWRDDEENKHDVVDNLNFKWKDESQLYLISYTHPEVYLRFSNGRLLHFSVSDWGTISPEFTE